MKRQQGNTVLAAMAVLAVFFIVFGIGVAVWLGGIYNGQMKLENNIHGANEKRVSSLSVYSQKIIDLVQVPKMATKQLKELVEANMQGRYGEDGSKAVFQFLKEQNVNVDQNMYSQIMRNMETGRNDFQSTQDFMISQKQIAYDNLNTLPNGWILKTFMGFPKKHYGYDGDTDDYKVLKSDHSAEAFATGIENGINLEGIVK